MSVNQFFMMVAANAAKRPPYTPLQYLESTGTQYIDTGMAPDFAGGDEIECHFYNASPGSGAVVAFGCRQTNVRNGIYATGGSVVFCDNAGLESKNFSVTGDTTIAAEGLTLEINATSYTMTKSVTCSFAAFLFALNNGGSAASLYNGMRLYRWRYWHNGTLAQDLVPALDANAVPCMWDTVSNTAKYNAGTGTFNYA